MITFFLTNPEREKSPISILICFRGSKFRKCIGEGIAPSKWNDKKRRVRVTSTNQEDSYINDQLDAWEKAGNEAIACFKDRAYVPAKDEFISILTQKRYQNTNTEHPPILKYFNTFIERYDGTRSKTRVKQYKNALKLLTRYENECKRTFYFEDIDINFYNKFERWFYKQNYSANYFGTIIKILKVVVNEARQVDKIHDSDGTKNRNFVSTQVNVDNIYLTEDELLKMHNLVITEELVKSKIENTAHWDIAKKVRAMNKARDMFLIGAFTGLRYSDYSRLDKENIGDNITIQAQKTGIKSVIPIHWVVKEIIDRGYDFSTSMFGQKVNHQIKDVAMLAGIDQEVTLIKNEAGKPITVTGPKYKYVCTHTARRSFATNAYKSGIPAISIMKITGHKSEASFLKYIKISEAENAELLQNHRFFTKPCSTDCSTENNDQTANLVDGFDSVTHKGTE